MCLLPLLEVRTFGVEAGVCEVGGLGSCFAHFQLRFFEVLSLVVLFLCTGAHTSSEDRNPRPLLWSRMLDPTVLKKCG